MGLARLSAPVAAVLDVARYAARVENAPAAERAFVSAAGAAYARPMAGRLALAEALAVAQEAARTPGSGDAAARILVNARDKFTSYAERSRIAAAAHELGQRDVHLELSTRLVTYAPSVEEHVRLAGVMARFAEQDAGYAPLVGRTLRRANDRTCQIAQTALTQAAALAHADKPAYLESKAIEETMRGLGEWGPGRHRRTSDAVLAVLRAPGAKAYQPLDSWPRRLQRVARNLVRRAFAGEARS